MWLLVLFVPALLGTIHHIIPFVIVRRISYWMDQPGRMTTSTHKMLVGIPIYTLWLIGVTVALWFYRPWIAWTWLAIAPFAGVLALRYGRQARGVLLLLYHEARVMLQREKLLEFREQLVALRERITRMSDDFEKISPPTAR